ncbi:MAG: ubiquitin-conjugating enzyme E2 [Janthinobacterium lividum]
MLDLAARNPGRLSHVQIDRSVLTLHLHGPAALAVSTDPTACPLMSHAVRIDFPVHFPAVPMEMFLQAPVVHPNIHPETGFVCLWQRHRVSNTVEHAMHRLVAMLAGEQQNPAPMHVMQPLALHHTLYSEPMPLLGVLHNDGAANPQDAALRDRRRRLQ